MEQPGAPAPRHAGRARRAGLRALVVLATWAGALLAAAGAQPAPPVDELALPPAHLQGPMSLEQALALRRSLRSFAATALTSAEVGQLLWAAQGITASQGRRTAPSAGATYPLALYLVAGRVDGLAPGLYRYLPQGHRLQALGRGDLRGRIAAAAHFQLWLREAPVQLVIAAQPARTQARYGSRATRYVAMEAGSAAQNVLLQAVALGLGGTVVGAFNDSALQELLALPDGEQPLALIPLGRPSPSP